MIRIAPRVVGALALLSATPAAAGTRRYTFTLTPLEDELTLANNSQEALVEAREGPARVLYLEGEPRWEHGKMRTSVTRDEKNLLLVRGAIPGANGGLVMIKKFSR